MGKIKIAHMADFHINTPFTSLDEEKAKIRRHELIESFENAINTAKSENTDIIVISGDLFDNSEDMRTVKYVMEKLGECGIPIFIAAGNHDPKSEIYDKITIPANVYVFGEMMECVRLDGVNIYGASFSQKNCPESLLKNAELADGINILVMHGDVSSGTYNPMDRKILSKFDYCALGHIHEYSGIVNEGMGAWAYSGFCEPRGFDEKGKGGIIIAEIEKGLVKAERKILSKREYIKKEIDISECSDNLDITDIIQDIVSPENLYDIELFGAKKEFTITPDYIKKCLEVFCFDIDIHIREGRDYEALADGYTLKGMFVSKMLDMASKASEADRKKYMRALDIGLDAFEKAGSKG